MELNWNLDKIYKSFDSKEFADDLIKLDTMISDINLFAEDVYKTKEDEKEKLEEYIKRFSKYIELVKKLTVYVELRLTTNTKDKDAIKYSGILENKLTSTVAAETKLNKWISSIKNIDLVIERSKLLKEHEFVIKDIVDQSKYLLSENEEAIISKMKNTGSNAWAKLKDSLISNLKVDIKQDGEVKSLPLTVVLNMAYDADREVRKRAYEAEIKSYVTVEEGVAAALNGIKGEVISICNMRGYKDPLDMTLKNSRMDKETLDAMFEAIEEKLPIFRKYLRKKASMLGYKNGLPWYEMYAPVSNAEMNFTYKEATEYIIKNFKTFSTDLSDFVKKAVDNSWIDVLPREGKVGGAFCAGIHNIGESRILTNFGGKFGDVVTLAHELGHGFHGECLLNESILNSDYPMPIAETASTFCETIIKKAALKEASKEEVLAILETEISDCTQVVVDIYSRFLFEKAVFDKRKESALSVDEIKECMLEAQRKAYGDGLDSEYLHPYMWIWKPHYYDADCNYYNFPYAFGLLFAKGLYAEYLKQGDTFVSQYEKLLSITGKNNVADVTKSVGIDIRTKEFWLNSLGIVEEDIEKFMKI